MSRLDDLASAFDDPAGLITDIAAEDVEVGGERARQLLLTFRVRDLRGDRYLATAKVLVPSAWAGERVPAWFNCGYELEDESVAAAQLRRGRAVVTPRNPQEGSVFPGSNPLLRGPNTDYVLAHLARGASFIDRAAIVYGGGSAGGYATLMVAAEAFPAAVAVPAGPPVNLGYQAAYMATVLPRLVADPPEGFPIIQMITSAFVEWIEPWKSGYGEDFGSTSWFDHSPVAHVDRITCPVQLMTSSADFLVPVDQFSRRFAEPTLADPPTHVTIAAEELDPSPLVATRLVDSLGERAQVYRVPLPEGAVNVEKLDLTMQVPQMPVSIAADLPDGKQWSINILDEGPIVMGATHGRHAVTATFEPFIGSMLDRGIGVDQLTPAKLDQLLDRYRGAEWLAPGYHHLDEPEAERADVLRGLALYRSQSDAHERRFAELYAAVEDARRVLPD